MASRESIVIRRALTQLLRARRTRIPPMLPDGFQWQSYMDSQALYLGERIIATYGHRPGAPFVLAYLHCGAARLTGRTFGSEQASHAYLEAWARKWQAQLREEYGLAVPAKQAKHPSGLGIAVSGGGTESG